jgi:ABC-2 type transport system ATP-binding protein
LLDEPTSGLDPKASYEFSHFILEMAASGAAVLMATHDLFRVKEMDARVGIMREGRLLQEAHSSEMGHSELEQVYLEHMRDAPR